jgi:hypothetical protein
MAPVTTRTYNRSWSQNPESVDPCSESTWFESWLGIVIEGIRGFNQALYTNVEILLRLRHDRFLPNPFQYILREFLYNPTTHKLRYW